MEVFGGSRPSKDFKDQNYNLLRKQQLARGVKFVDDAFPIDKMTLFGFDPSSLEFKRPTEVVDSPTLKSDFDYFSLRKGMVDNFNILLAFTSLKYRHKLWEKVFVDYRGQDWSKIHQNEHSGIFRVRIWQEGVYLNVTIDDRLPFFKGRFLSTCSSSPQEFWPSLLEKAYAKLLGGYDRLEHVRLEEIMMDLTGGVAECIDLIPIGQSPPMKHVELFERLEEALKEDTLVILCTQPPNPATYSQPTVLGIGKETTISDQFGSPGPMDSQLDPDTGLCLRYGYLLTRCCILPHDTSRFAIVKDLFRRIGDCPIRARLLRLRCPLTVTEGGSGFGEWKGPFSSESPEWEVLDLEIRRRFRLTFDSEAEFWIPLEQLVRNVQGAVLCRLPNVGGFDLMPSKWQLCEHHGAWHGHLTGGCLRYRDSFLNNPQYMFDISSDGEEVFLCLLQKYDRDPSTEMIEPTSYLRPIGLGLFQVENNRSIRVHNLSLTRIIYVEATKPYRMVLIRHWLKMGRYVVIPFLEDPIFSAAYLLRCYLPKQSLSKELTMDIPPMSEAVKFFRGTYKQAIRIRVHSAVNLLWPDGKKPPSPYCFITYEDGSLQTSVKHATSNPVWDEYFLIYRRRPGKTPIVIQIFDKHTFGFDVFLGRYAVKENELIQSPHAQQELPLFGRDTKEECFIRAKGSLFMDFYAVGSEFFMQI